MYIFLRVYSCVVVEDPDKPLLSVMFNIHLCIYICLHIASTSSINIKDNESAIFLERNDPLGFLIPLSLSVSLPMKVFVLFLLYFIIRFIHLFTIIASNYKSTIRAIDFISIPIGNFAGFPWGCPWGFPPVRGTPSGVRSTGNAPNH